MRAYLVVFLVSFIIQLIPIHTDKEYRWKVFFTFIPIFLFGALRIDFGLDYEAYEEIYYMSHYWLNLKYVSDHAEIGYLFLNSVIPSWRLLLIITSAFTCVSYGFVFYKFVPQQKSWLAICLFFLAGDKTIFFMYSGMRNAIAISIMLLSVILIRDRKWIPYFILTFIAIQFHVTAILFMPLAYLLGFGTPMNRREAIVWIGAMLLLQVISLEAIFENVTIYVDQYFDRYNTYVEKAQELGDTRTVLIKFTVGLFVIGIVWFMRTTELTNDEAMVCRLALLFAMAGLLGALSMRFYQCFIYFLIFGTIIMFNKWKMRPVSHGFLLFCLLYLGYAFFGVFMQREGFPYEIYHSLIGDF